MVDNLVLIDLNSETQLDKLAAAVVKRIPAHVCRFPPADIIELSNVARNVRKGRATAWAAAIGFLVISLLSGLGFAVVSWVRAIVSAAVINPLYFLFRV